MPKDDAVSLTIAIDTSGADASLAKVGQAVEAMGSAITDQAASIEELGKALKDTASATKATTANLGVEAEAHRKTADAINQQADAAKRLNTVQATRKVVPNEERSRVMPLLAPIPAGLYAADAGITFRNLPRAGKRKEYAEKLKEEEEFIREEQRLREKAEDRRLREEAKRKNPPTPKVLTPNIPPPPKEPPSSSGGGGGSGGRGAGPTGDGLASLIKPLSGLGIVKAAFSGLTSVITGAATIIFTAMKAAFVGITAVGIGALAGLGAGLYALKSAVDAVEAVFDKGAGIANLSQQTGVGVESILKLERGFKAAGLSAEQVAPTLGRMAKAIYEASNNMGEAKDTFKALHLETKALKDMSPEAAFLKIGEAINKLPNGIERSAAAMRIFQETGSSLLSIFGNAGAIGKMNEELSNSGKIMAQDALLFRLASERLEKVKMPTLKEGLGQVATGIADKVAPVFLAITEDSKRIDFSNIGQAIGGEVALGMEAFKQGQFGEYVIDSIRVVGPQVKAFFSNLFSGDGDLLKSPAMQFGIHLMDAVAGIGVEIAAQLNGPIEALTGVSLGSMLSSMTSFVVSAAGMFVTVGSVIANATLQLVLWGEKVVSAFKEITGFVGRQVDKIPAPVRAGIKEAAITTGLAMIPIVGPELAGRHVANKIQQAADLTPGLTQENYPKPQTADEARLYEGQQKIAGVTASLDKILDAISQGGADYAAKINDASGRSAEQRAAAEKKSAERRAELEAEAGKDRSKYTAAAAANSTQGGGEHLKPVAAGMPAVIADSLQSMGGGGGFYAGVGGGIEDNTARTAENTAKTADTINQYLTSMSGLSSTLRDTSPSVGGRSPVIGSSPAEDRQVSLLGDMKSILANIYDRMASGNGQIAITTL